MVSTVTDTKPLAILVTFQIRQIDNYFRRLSDFPDVQRGLNFSLSISLQLFFFPRHHCCANTMNASEEQLSERVHQYLH